MGKNYRNYSSTFNTPRRPFEKERIDNELGLIGKYGLKNKREVWRCYLILSKFRKAARELLTLQQKDPRRLFEGAALLRRMHRYGLLTSEELKLDYVLGLTVNKILDKRLQTRIYNEGFLAKSIHQARVLIRQRHIRVGKNLVNAPSFLVRTESEKKINLASLSPFETRQPSRTSKKRNKGKQMPPKPHQSGGISSKNPFNRPLGDISGTQKSAGFQSANYASFSQTTVINRDRPHNMNRDPPINIGKRSLLPDNNNSGLQRKAQTNVPSQYFTDANERTRLPSSKMTTMTLASDQTLNQNSRTTSPAPKLDSLTMMIKTENSLPKKMSDDKYYENQQIRKTRITFSSGKLDTIQQVTNSLVGNAKKGGIKIKGPVMLPNKHLRICSRRTPCGEGSKTWDNWEMTVHKRYIDVEYTDAQLREITSINIPNGVEINVELKQSA